MKIIAKGQSAYGFSILKLLSFFFAVFLIGLILPACKKSAVVSKPKIQIIKIAGENKTTLGSAKHNFENLEYILKNCFTRNRELKIFYLRRHIKKLETQLKILAEFGPVTTPGRFKTDWDKTAYWLNARAAWSIYFAYLQTKKPAKKRSCDFSGYRFMLDGKLRSMNYIDLKLEKNGGMFAILAAPGVSSQRAQIPKKPFVSTNLHSRLEARFSEFIDDSKKIVLDVDNQVVEFPPVIWKYRRRIISKYATDFGVKNVSLTTALLPFVKGPALNKLQNAVGYKCMENSQKPKLVLHDD